MPERNQIVSDNWKGSLVYMRWLPVKWRYVTNNYFNARQEQLCILCQNSGRDCQKCFSGPFLPRTIIFGKFGSRQCTTFAGRIESRVPSIFGFTFLLAYRSRLQPLSTNNIIIEFYYWKYTYIHWKFEHTACSAKVVAKDCSARGDHMQGHAPSILGCSRPFPLPVGRGFSR